MCDFSLMHAKSRPAKVADRLTTKDFGRGTTGFCDISETDTPCSDATAVCVLPGTEIVFDKAVAVRSGWYWSINKVDCRTARFRQIDTSSKHAHHDALEFATGEIVKLTTLHQGQNATVLQLPAAPKNEVEAQEQKRLEIVA
jgi:hypothetical protein